MAVVDDGAPVESDEVRPTVDKVHLEVDKVGFVNDEVRLEVDKVGFVNDEVRSTAPSASSSGSLNTGP